MKISFTASAFIYGAALLSGFSYLAGFWIPFNFNIFEHIEVLDVLRVSLLPLVPMIVTTAGSSGIGALTGLWAARHDFSEEEKGTRGTGFANSAKWMVSGVLAALLLFGLPDILFGAHPLIRLKGFYPVASILAALFLIREKQFLAGLPIGVRTVLIFVACSVPSGAMNLGYKNGQQALSNSSPGYYVTASKDCNSGLNESFRYLSVIGKKLFAVSTTNGMLCVTPADSFRLIRYSPSGDGENQDVLQEWLRKWP